MEEKDIRQRESGRTRKIAVTGILGAITIMLGLTPFGFIPLGIFSVTTIHIPVIIAAILEGPVVGGLVGLIFGLTSFIQHLTAPKSISFIFWNPMVSVFPRVMIGVLSYYFFVFVSKGTKRERLSYLLTGAFGTFVNTLLVLGGAYVFYAKDLVEKFQLSEGASVFLFGIAAKNGIPEMIFSAVITLSVVTAVKKIRK